MNSKHLTPTNIHIRLIEYAVDCKLAYEALPGGRPTLGQSRDHDSPERQEELRIFRAAKADWNAAIRILRAYEDATATSDED